MANFRTFWKATTFSSVPRADRLPAGVRARARRDRRQRGGRPRVRRVRRHRDGRDRGDLLERCRRCSARSSSTASSTYDAILAAPVDVEEPVRPRCSDRIRAGFYGCFLLIVSMFFGLDPRRGCSGAALLLHHRPGVRGVRYRGRGHGRQDRPVQLRDDPGHTPLFLVAGTFFPTTSCPRGLQVAANVNPLYQLVELVRYAAPSASRRPRPDPIAVLALFALGMRRIAVRRMELRLID